MDMKRKAWALACATALSCGMAGASHAAVISNGTIWLGVNEDGSLNDSAGARPAGSYQDYGIGVFDSRTLWEATYDGCTCENWGVSGLGYAAWADSNSGGIQAQWNTGISIGGFTFNGSTATSVVNIVDQLSNPFLQVVHEFVPSATADLYKVNVYIKNVGTQTVDDLLYRRSMDWDIEPTPFNEYVTIGGVRDAAGNLHPNIAYSSDNGFANGNPLSYAGWINSGTELQNFEDSGPADHGAVFNFKFDPLEVGDTQQFSIFYGAALSEAAAHEALAKVGAEIYSFGQAFDSADGGPGNPSSGYSTDRSTFIFAFDIDNDGSTFDLPILPTTIEPDGSFVFRTTVNPGERFVIDPDYASGYIYELFADPLGAYFGSLELEDLGDPDGYDIYDLAGNVIALDFMPSLGNVLDLSSLKLTGFKILDISTDLKIDPTDIFGFKTGLTVAGITGPTEVEITQTPIKTFVPDTGAVPEPTTWMMMIGGLALTGAAMRRRKLAVSFA